LKKLILFIMITLMASVSVAQSTSLIDAVSYLIDRNDGHPKKGDREWSIEMAVMLEEVAEEFDLDPWLLVAMANPESHFRPDIVSGKKLGPAGEKGILQCGKDCLRKCPHFHDTAKDMARCGANWFRMALDTCKGKGGKHSDEWAGLAYYASGKYCDPPPDTRASEKGLTYVQKADKRIKLRDRLKNRFGK
jgi:hypothetical protein